MIKFSDLTEKKKKSQAEPKNQPTAISAPIRGANQDQSGINDKNDYTDYTISDGFIAGVSAHGGRSSQVAQRKGAMGKTLNAPASAVSLRAASVKTDIQLDKMDQKNDEQQVKNREQQIKNRKKMSEEFNNPSTAVVNKGISKPKTKIPNASTSPQPPVARPVMKESKTYMSFADFVEFSEQNIKEETIDEARGRPKKNPTEEDPGSEHPMMQMRKVISTRGQHVFTHISGEKHKIEPKIAHAVLAHHDNLKTSAEKQAYATRIHRSKASMNDALAGKAEPVKPKVTLAGKH
jgi:hypothetical protein